MKTNHLSQKVTDLLDNLDHPMRAEIDLLRNIILDADSKLTENVKWNGPNYCYFNEDRITMRVYPVKQIQIIFHRGAKKLAQPKEKLIEDKTGLLLWKEHDRAIATFKSLNDISTHKSGLSKLVNKWIKASK